MKKLMFVAALTAAMTGVCDVTSSNCVGYQEKGGTVKNYNFVTPTFRTVGGDDSKMNIQDLQMDSTVTLGNAQFMTLNASRAATVTYKWVPKAACATLKLDCPADKNGVWAIQSGATFSLPTAEASVLPAGTGIQIFINGTGKKYNFAGQVADEQVALTTVKNYNFVGNCFPADGDIRDIQMDTTVTLGNAQFMRLNASRAATATYKWVPKAAATTLKLGDYVREGDNGIWAIQNGATFTVPPAEDMKLTAGEGVQIFVNGTSKIVYVNPSYTL